MKKQYVLFPDRIALAKFSDIVTFEQEAGTVTSPTIYSLQSFLAAGYKDIKLGTEGVQVARQQTAIDVEQITPAGIQDAEVLLQSNKVQITLTANAWSLAIDALLAGKSFDDVVDDAKVNQAGSNYTYDAGSYVTPATDVSNARGVLKGDTIYREKFALLVRCPVRNGHVWLLAPKVVVRPDNQDTTMVLDQIKPAIALTALSLEDEEVAPFVQMYDQVSQFGLVYRFFVPTQAE